MMKISRPNVGLCTILVHSLVLLLGAESHAVLYVGNKVAPESVEAQFHALIAKHPGLSQYPEEAKQYLRAAEGEQDLLAQLGNFSGYAEMATEKPELQTLSFEVQGEDEAMESVLTPEAVLKRKNEMIGLIDQNLGWPPIYGRFEYGLFVRLVRRASEISGLLAGRDPRGMITGIVNSLPVELRGAYFRLGSDPLVQVRALKNEMALTDQVLHQNFKTENFKLTEDQLSKDALLNLIENLILLQREAVAGARFIAYSLDHAELGLYTPKGPFWEDSAGLKDFILNKSDVRSFSLTFKEVGGKLPRIIDALVGAGQGSAPWVTEYFKKFLDERSKHDFEIVKHKKGSLRYRVVEQPPFVGIFRSTISHDCSSTDSWAIPYSPMEREYFVYLPSGKLVAHVGATHTLLNGVKTLYVHDVKGNQLSPEVGEFVLHALYAQVKQLGAEQISLATEAQTNSSGNSPQMKAILASHRSAEIYNQVYPDEKIRMGLVGNQPKSGLTYDAPNQRAHLFVPDSENLKKIDRVQVEFQKGHGLTTLDEYLVQNPPETKMTEDEVGKILIEVIQHQKEIKRLLSDRPLTEKNLRLLAFSFQNPKIGGDLLSGLSRIESHFGLLGFKLTPEWTLKHLSLFDALFRNSNDWGLGDRVQWRPLLVAWAEGLVLDQRWNDLYYFLRGSELSQDLMCQPEFLNTISRVNWKSPEFVHVSYALKQLGVDFSSPEASVEQWVRETQKVSNLRVLNGAEQLFRIKKKKLITPGVLLKITEFLPRLMAPAGDPALAVRALRLLSRFAVQKDGYMERFLESYERAAGAYPQEIRARGERALARLRAQVRTGDFVVRSVHQK